MLQFSHPLSRQERRLRWGLLGFLAVPMIGPFFYSQGYKISVLTCPIRHFTGVPCPTCGMTRSFIAIVQGDWKEAISQHLFGPILFTLFGVATIHIISELSRKRHLKAFYIDIARQRLVQVGSLTAYFGYYFLRLYQGTITDEWVAAFVQSPWEVVHSSYTLLS